MMLGEVSRGKCCRNIYKYRGCFWINSRILFNKQRMHAALNQELVDSSKIARLDSTLTKSSLVSCVVYVCTCAM